MTAPRPLVLTDLDGTLIASRGAVEAAIAEGAVSAEALEVVDEADGRPCGFMTSDAIVGLEELCDCADVVPVTARSRGRLARLRLGTVTFDDAIVSAGAHLLVGGRPDPDWRRVVEAASARCEPAVLVRDRVVAGLAGTDRVPPRVDVQDGVVVIVRLGDPKDAATVTAIGATAGWSCGWDGRRAFLLPRGVGKLEGAQEVARRRGASEVVVAGDGPLDAEMLDWAGTAVTPTPGLVTGGHPSLVLVPGPHAVVRGMVVRRLLEVTKRASTLRS